MKKQFLTILSVSTMMVVSAQNPEIEAWMLNTNGHQANYNYYPGPPPATTNIQLSDSSDIKNICYNINDVYVRANGLASYTMGPWTNPNVPSNQNYTIKIPRNPVEETGTKTATPFGGAQAFAINGVAMFGYGDGKSYSSAQGANVNNGDGNWDSDAWIAEGTTMDATGGGHPTNLGMSHYHATPFALYTDPSTGHSVIIGYSLDGFPIYGPFGYVNPINSSSGITRMISSYQLRNITDRTILPGGSTSTPAGPVVSGTFPLGTYVQDYEYVVSSGTLDEYNGRYCVTPDYPGGTYAYFLSTDVNGDPQFPYIMASEYYGVLSMPDLMSGGNSTSPAGLTCYTGVGMEEGIVEGFKIYPNPANKFLTIELSNGSNNEVEIFNVSGELVFSGVIKSTSNQINVEDLPSGLYIVSLINSETGKMKNNRLVVE